MNTQETTQIRKRNCKWVMTGLVLGMLLWAGPEAVRGDEIWTEKSPMSTARLGLATSAVRGKIYAIGGYMAAGDPGLKTVEEYDPQTDIWTSKANMPTGRRWLATSVANGKIYAIGGFANNGTPGLSTVEMYNPETDIWTRKADMPTPRKFLSAGTVDGKIYAIGGSSSVSGLPALATVEVYDPQTDSWMRKADMPTARIMLSSSVVNGKIYVMGGTQSPSWGFSTVEEYDPMTDTWARKADMLMAVAGVSTSSLNGYIYAVGGGLSSSGPTLFFTDAYDPATDTWTRKSDMPTNRWALCTSVVNNRIYAIGGAETANVPHPGTTLVEEYDPNPLVVDFNGDGIVDCADICMMVEYWHTDEPFYDIAPPPFGDGIVDAEDIALLAEHLFEEILPPGLVAFWKLDETEGIVAHDSAGQNDAALIGDPAWQPDAGKVGGALALDGIDDSAFAQFVLNPSDGPFSVFAWVEGGVPGQAVVSQVDGADWLGTDPSKGALMTTLTGSGRSGVPLLSQTVITDGNWHRIGLVWDGSNRALYVDGVAVAEDTQNNLESSSNGLYIGAGEAMLPGTFFSGLIDDVRIYDRAVTP